MSETVFALDVEMVSGVWGNRVKNLAARVVLYKRDAKYGTENKVLDTYVSYPEGVVRSYNTRWSHIEPYMLRDGVSLPLVRAFLLELVEGHTLVTFAGKGDLASLCLQESEVRRRVAKYVDLQSYFVRPNGMPYALGPLVDYFGYSRSGRQVVIDHDCVDDAYFTLRLYLDHYLPYGIFEPVVPVLNKQAYKEKYGLV